MIFNLLPFSLKMRVRPAPDQLNKSEAGLLCSHHLIDQRLVCLVDNGCSAKLTLSLGGHFGQDVALVSVLALVTRGTFLEAFGRSGVYFQF